MLRAELAGVSLDCVASGFEVGGEAPDRCGPGGIVFGPGEQWLVTNSGTGALLRVDGTGGRDTAVLNPDCGLSDLAVTPDGRLFGSRRHEIVEVDPSTGVVLATLAAGFSELVGLVFDAASGKLVVADFSASAIYEVDHLTGGPSKRAAGAVLGNPNGIVVDDSGRVIVAGYGSKHVLRVEVGGSVTDLGHLPGGPDGVALGAPGGPFEGAVIVNQRDGSVVAIGPHGEVVTLAAGGTPGDLIAVDAQGYLLVTQLEEIFRLSPPWFQPQPWRDLPPQA